MQDLRTPHHYYWVPILIALEQQGGTARTKIIRQQLQLSMKGVFNSHDLGTVKVSDDRYEPAWWNRARHAAERMREEGKHELLEPSVKSTVWTISQKGRAYLKRKRSEHFSANGIENRDRPLADEEADLTEENEGAPYKPDTIDRRSKVERQICERRGQQRFRDSLRKWYGDRCMLSSCKVLAVLEAAHIKPYRGTNDQHPQNGLLLREDIHTLFDLNLIGIEPKTLQVELHPGLTDDQYTILAGRALVCVRGHRPSAKALEM
jgi:hypothetical protein